MGTHYEDAGTFTDLKGILNNLLDLRLPGKEEPKNEFWSFRGQRNADWGLSIVHRSYKSHDKHDVYLDSYEQYRRRMVIHKDVDYNFNDKNPWLWLFMHSIIICIPGCWIGQAIR
jgi:hypothetical protein